MYIIIMETGILRGASTVQMKLIISIVNRNRCTVINPFSIWFHFLFKRSIISIKKHFMYFCYLFNRNSNKTIPKR